MESWDLISIVHEYSIWRKRSHGYKWSRKSCSEVCSVPKCTNGRSCLLAIVYTYVSSLSPCSEAGAHYITFVLFHSHRALTSMTES